MLASDPFIWTFFLMFNVLMLGVLFPHISDATHPPSTIQIFTQKPALSHLCIHHMPLIHLFFSATSPYTTYLFITIFWTRPLQSIVYDGTLQKNGNIIYFIIIRQNTNKYTAHSLSSSTSTNKDIQLVSVVALVLCGIYYELRWFFLLGFAVFVCGVGVGRGVRRNGDKAHWRADVLMRF